MVPDVTLKVSPLRGNSDDSSIFVRETEKKNTRKIVRIFVNVFCLQSVRCKNNCTKERKTQD